MILKEFGIYKSRKVYTCDVCEHDIKKGIVDNIVSMSLSREFTNEEIYDLINR